MIKQHFLEKTNHFWGPSNALFVLNHGPVQHQPTLGLDALGTTQRRHFPEILFLFSLIAQWQGTTYCQPDLALTKMREGTCILCMQLIPSRMHPCAMFVGKPHMLTGSYHIPWGAQSPMASFFPTRGIQVCPIPTIPN